MGSVVGGFNAKDAAVLKTWTLQEAKSAQRKKSAGITTIAAVTFGLIATGVTALVGGSAKNLIIVSLSVAGGIALIGGTAHFFEMRDLEKAVEKEREKDPELSEDQAFQNVMTKLAATLPLEKRKVW
jgi:hypothetical protein